MATEPAVLQESLFVLQPSWGPANVIEEHSRRSANSVANPSPRTVDSVANPSWGFYESEDLHLSSVSRRTVNQKSMKIGEPWARWQSLSEIPRILEKFWTETHQNLKWLSQIEGTSLKFKNQKRFLFRSRYIYSGQKKT